MFWHFEVPAAVEFRFHAFSSKIDDILTGSRHSRQLSVVVYRFRVRAS